MTCQEDDGNGGRACRLARIARSESLELVEAVRTASNPLMRINEFMMLFDDDTCEDTRLLCIMEQSQWLSIAFIEPCG